jgi:hypothetical protein
MTEEGDVYISQALRGVMVDLYDWDVQHEFRTCRAAVDEVVYGLAISSLFLICLQLSLPLFYFL